MSSGDACPSAQVQQQQPPPRQAGADDQDAFRRITMLGIEVTQEQVCELMDALGHNIGLVMDAVLRAQETSSPVPDDNSTAATEAGEEAVAEDAAATTTADDSCGGEDHEEVPGAAAPADGETSAPLPASDVPGDVAAATATASSEASLLGDRGSSDDSVGAVSARPAKISNTTGDHYNAALHKPCWQSSCWDAEEHPASHAVDGVWQVGQRRRRQQARAAQGGALGSAAALGLTLGNGAVGFGLGHDTVFSHTASEEHAWLAVDLGAVHDVVGAAVFNRTSLFERRRLYPAWVLLLPEGSSGSTGGGSGGGDGGGVTRAKSAQAQGVDEVLELLVPDAADGSGDAYTSGAGRRGVVSGLLDRVKAVAVAAQRITADMEGADGKIGHRVLCHDVTGRGRYVVLMLEGKNFLHVAQLQVWAHRLPDSPPSTPSTAVSTSSPAADGGGGGGGGDGGAGSGGRSTSTATAAATSTGPDVSQAGGGGSSGSGGGSGDGGASGERPAAPSRKEVRDKISAQYATRRAEKKAERLGANKAHAAVASAASATERTRQAAAERNEALGELGDRAAALASNTSDYLAAARRLNQR